LGRVEPGPRRGAAPAAGAVTTAVTVVLPRRPHPGRGREAPRLEPAHPAPTAREWAKVAEGPDAAARGNVGNGLGRGVPRIGVGQGGAVDESAADDCVVSAERRQRRGAVRHGVGLGQRSDAYGDAYEGSAVVRRDSGDEWGFGRSVLAVRTR